MVYIFFVLYNYLGFEILEVFLWNCWFPLLLPPWVKGIGGGVVWWFPFPLFQQFLLFGVWDFECLMWDCTLFHGHTVLHLWRGCCTCFFFRFLTISCMDSAMQYAKFPFHSSTSSTWFVLIIETKHSMVSRVICSQRQLRSRWNLVCNGVFRLHRLLLRKLKYMPKLYTVIVKCDQ